MKDPGIRHLAISVDDFDAAMEELRKRGVEFLTQPIDMQGNRLIFFSDGDGNFVHLIQSPAAASLTGCSSAGLYQ